MASPASQTLPYCKQHWNEKQTSAFIIANVLKLPHLPIAARVSRTIGLPTVCFVLSSVTDGRMHSHVRADEVLSLCYVWVGLQCRLCTRMLFPPHSAMHASV